MVDIMNLFKKITIPIIILLIVSLSTTGVLAENTTDTQVVFEEDFVITELSAIPSGNPVTLSANTELPSYYSSKDEGYTTTVKTQGLTNNCWAYSATTIMEILLNKNGLYNGTFSTSHIDNWATVNEDGVGWVRSFRTTGGYSNIPIGYLTSWLGPRLEAIFNDNMSKLPFDGLLLDEYPEYAVTSIINLTTSDDETIKTAIMEYGSVWASYSHIDKYLSEDDTSYCNNSTNETSGEHAITVIGWDDNYSKENFDGAGQPTKDGAWIIQNSWGEFNSIGGYMYVSYEDSNLFSDDFDSFAVSGYQQVKSNNKIYQLETLGSVYTPALQNRYGKNVVFMNVFDFDENTTIDKILFEYQHIGNDYDLYYVPIDSTTGKPNIRSQLWTKIGSGTVDYNGVICNDITDIDIASGKGAIAVCIKSDSSGTTYGVGICSDYENIVTTTKYQENVSYIATQLTPTSSIYTLPYAYSDRQLVIKAITYDKTHIYNMGDVNMDDNINIKDATLIQKHIVELRLLNDDELALADYDDDLSINGNDVLLIQKYSAGY